MKLVETKDQARYALRERKREEVGMKIETSATKRKSTSLSHRRHLTLAGSDICRVKKKKSGVFARVSAILIKICNSALTLALNCTSFQLVDAAATSMALVSVLCVFVLCQDTFFFSYLTTRNNIHHCVNKHLR